MTTWEIDDLCLYFGVVPKEARLFRTNGLLCEMHELKSPGAKFQLTSATSQKALARTLPSKAGTESFEENLSPGIYFWRLELPEGGGWLVGKLLVLRG